MLIPYNIGDYMKNIKRKTKNIEEISEIIAGINLTRYRKKTENKDKVTEYQVLTIKSIKENHIDKTKFDILETDKKINEKYLAKKEDVILGMDPPYYSMYINKEYDKVLISNAFAIIRSDEINQEYLSYYLKSDNFLSQLNKITEGTRNNKLTLANIKCLNVEILEEKETEKYIEIMRLLDERVQLKTEELGELKKIRKYYLNMGDIDECE